MATLLPIAPEPRPSGGDTSLNNNQVSPPVPVQVMARTNTSGYEPRRAALYRAIPIRVTSLTSVSPHAPLMSAQRNFQVPRRVV
jgi:hypothetical protein